MADNLLKVGGVSPTKTAQPLKLGSLGALKTNQYPSTSFFLGAVNEPTVDGHVGAYGVFGIEVLRTNFRGATNIFNRYQSTTLAKNGKYYYISSIADGAGAGASLYIYINMVDTVSQDTVTQLTTFNPVSGGSAQPLTIIDLGSNIAVVNQLGVGSLYKANTLEYISEIAWDITAYKRGSNELATNINAHASVQIKAAASTFVLSAHRLSEYGDDGVKVTHKDIQDWISTNAYISAIRNFDANNKYFFITASLKGTTSNDGYAILIIKRSDLSLVKMLQAVEELPKTIVPAAFASDSDEIFYTVEGANGNIYKWTISGSTATFNPTMVDSLGFAAGVSVSTYFVHHKNGLTLIRTLNHVYLYDFNELTLKWRLEIPTIGSNATCWFDGLGHVLFGDADNNIMLATKYLQVQGYGVKG